MAVTGLPTHPFVTDWLDQHARSSPDRIALTDAATSEAISFRMWNERVNRTARYLARRGVGKGDRVAILARRRVIVLDLWLACGKLGAVAQMLNVRLTNGELTEQLGEPPRLLVHDDDARRALADDTLSLDELERGRVDELAELEAVDLRPEEPWVVCYTGGSTGAPKGAILTHGGIRANAEATVAAWKLRADDVTVLNAPLFHVGGLLVLTAPLLVAGGRSIVCDRFDAGEVLTLFATEGVTVFFGVPTMHLALTRHSRFDTTDLRGLRFVVSGGAPCPESVLDAMAARGVPFRQGYGLTEAGPNNFVVPDDELVVLRGSVGYPIPGVEASTVDALGARVSVGHAGELCLRGPHLFAGYLGTSVESIRDGWLHTGDLAVVNARGAYSIVGRLKEVILSGGENIYPAEIERVLSAHANVAEVCVISIPDARLGEVGRAVIVPRGGCVLRTELLAHARRHLARFKVPRDIVFAEVLPRTATGKIDRRAVASWFGDYR